MNNQLMRLKSEPIKIDDELLFRSTDPLDIKDLEGVKILHAPFEIAGQMGQIANLLKELKIDATSVSYYNNWLNYKCDINLGLNNLPQKEANRKIDGFAKYAIDRYDIFHFHFSRSLYPDYRDLEILKKKGKKIIFSFWGIDMRSPEWYYYNQAKFLGYEPPKPYFISRDLYALHRFINRYADVMLGTVCLPRGLFIPGMVDFAKWDPEDRYRIRKESTFVKDPDKVYFLHAPTSNWKKGSYMVVKLLEECKNEGMPIETLFVSKIPPKEAKKIYAEADFAIDMVGHGTFGTFGLEMMGWEIPLMVYQDNLWDKIRNNPPVIKLSKKNFKDKIKECIELKRNGKSDEVGKHSRTWAISHGELRLTGIPNYVKIYADLMRGKKVKQYINPSWYEQEYLLQMGNKSNFYKYMIAKGVFNEIGIQLPNYDKHLYA